MEKIKRVFKFVVVFLSLFGGWHYFFVNYDGITVFANKGVWQTILCLFIVVSGGICLADLSWKITKTGN